MLGLVLLPLSFSLAGQPVRLLQIAFVAAVFEAAAALVIGAFGLQPALVPGLLFGAYIGMQYVMGMRYPGEGLVLRTAVPLVLLLGYALISIVLLPDAFAGKIMISPQKPNPLGPVLTPLEYTSGNLTQALYLTLNVGVAIIAALFLTRVAVPYRQIISAYLLSGYIVVFVALWEFASRMGGIPFPEEVLYSNPGWAIVHQALGSVPRLQASFSEPAGLATYLSGLCFCCLWLVARGHRVMRPDLLLAFAIVVMLLSTSTTGIACLAIGLPLVLVFAAGQGSPRILARIGRLVMLLGVTGALVIGPIFVLQPQLFDSVNTVIESTLSKQDSDSYDIRSTLDEAALATVTQTYGLGVGWGSFRASSLMPGLLANAGVFGAAMLVWLAMRMTRLASRAARLSPGHPGRTLVDGFSAALCGQLAAALLSAPAINSVAFFLQLGCVIGTAARMCIEANRPGPAPAYRPC